MLLARVDRVVANPRHLSTSNGLGAVGPPIAHVLPDDHGNSCYGAIGIPYSILRDQITVLYVLRRLRELGAVKNEQSPSRSIDRYPFRHTRQIRQSHAVQLYPAFWNLEFDSCQ